MFTRVAQLVERRALTPKGTRSNRVARAIALLLAVWITAPAFASERYVAPLYIPVLADIRGGGAASGGSTIGSAVSGATATRVLFVDGAGNLANDADMTFATDALTITKVVLPNSAGAPSLYGASSSTTGLDFVAASNSSRWYASGTAILDIGGGWGTVLKSDWNYCWASTTLGSGVDTCFVRAAPGQTRVITGTSTIGAQYDARPVESNATTKAVTLLESGEVYVSGDVDGSAVTLPNDPTVGVTYTVVVDQTQTSSNVALAPNTGESILNAGTTATTSCTSTQVGASITVVAATGGSGARWVVTSIVGTWSCS